MSLNATPLRLRTIDSTFEAAFQARLHWSPDTDAAIEQRVADILADVQARGDAAVLEYTLRFDRLTAASMADLNHGRALTPAKSASVRALSRAFAPPSSTARSRARSASGSSSRQISAS